MGNEALICCQKNNNEKINDETTLFSREQFTNDRNKITNQNTFQKIFDEKLPEFGYYSEISDLNDKLPNKIKETMQTNPLDISIYSTNNPKVYSTRPITFKNGNVYEGNWNAQIEMEGYGKLYLKADNVFVEGFWKNGVMHNGRIYFPNGDIYEGNIENSLFHGKGTLFFIDGSIYKGDFILGQRNGNGIQSYCDGSEYSGEFKSDLFNGQGDFKWANGYRYIGKFEGGQLCGKGKLSCKENKSVYEGGFYKNKFHGKGMFIWGNSGNVYKGEYEFGKKQGKGEFKKLNGFQFTGGFNDNKIHGNGEIREDERIIKCYWRNGQMVEKPVIDFIGATLEKNSESKVMNCNWIIDKEDLYPEKLEYLYREEEDNVSYNASSLLPIENFTE